MVIMLMILMMTEVEIIILLKIQILGATLALGIRIVGVALVETIDKRSIFCLGNSTDR